MEIKTKVATKEMWREINDCITRIIDEKHDLSFQKKSNDNYMNLYIQTAVLHTLFGLSDELRKIERKYTE
ncbi:hypothetical protein ACWF7H_17365 [Peribacillus butanolivorans]|uniref:hypothetical protein n=1 Tax=Peribacillus TaxID=2675229 RepID=UPI0019138EE7|nr:MULTISPECIES: hypothetical protein [unclassified Peribacillus]MBK5443257.1 hypothetical protein [Peribacillus sp. TH24]MBK5484666.1 hypothetical protein [Peribacillus sp. TH16]